MNILYHLTVLPPKMPECEALSQEIMALRRHFGGELIYLNPNQHSPIYLPRLLFGFHKLNDLRTLEATLDIHQVYNPDPFPFPVLRCLRKPVIYIVSSGVSERRPNIAFFSKLAAVAVSDERSFDRLQACGLDNVFLVRAGIDTGRFSFSPLPLHSNIRLMIASAPWTEKQFQTKGIDALLAAAQRNPRLELVFLWRGVLVDEMENRVKRMGLEKQVEVINQSVDVNQVLAGVHASIALATAPGIIKAYPHSLLDSLAAGKPVLVSRAIPMSDYVERVGCGKVVEQVRATDILAAIEKLAEDYTPLQKTAWQVGPQDFSLQTMVSSFQNVYEQVFHTASKTSSRGVKSCSKS
jgi:glycosyltransferase involved in cell wall biosynthesis